MTPEDSSGLPVEAPATRAVFATTRWTVVLGAATGSDTTRAGLALEELCRLYWRPIYSFVRRQGHSPHDAQDLTQEFFSRLLSRRDFGTVDPAKGRFRSFLLAALKHFLANEWDKVRTLKRGGGVRVLPLEVADAAGDTDAGEGAAASGWASSPERAFDRQWALALLARVLARLREEHVAAGKTAFFELLGPTLTADRASLPYALIGSRLGLSEGAVKVAVHRLRQRYRELLRDEIADTVDSKAQVEEELRDLFAALSG